MNIYAYKYTYMPAITNNEKEAMNFKKIKERVDGRSEKGGEAREKCCNCIIISKITLKSTGKNKIKVQELCNNSILKTL